MSVLHLNESEFDAKITSAPLAMVDFWATWCGPCKMLAPVIEDLGGKYDGKAVVAKVDVDQNQGLAARYGVMSIPTVVFFKDGKEIGRKVGVMPAGGLHPGAGRQPVKSPKTSARSCASSSGRMFVFQCSLAPSMATTSARVQW